LIIQHNDVGLWRHMCDVIFFFFFFFCIPYSSAQEQQTITICTVWCLESYWDLLCWCIVNVLVMCVRSAVWMQYTIFRQVKTLRLCMVEGKGKKRYRSPCRKPWRHVWVSELQLHFFLTWMQDGGEWSGSRPGRFTAPKTRVRSVNGRMDPRVVVVFVEERNLVFLSGFEPQTVRLRSPSYRCSVWPMNLTETK
jgi:hypothetical protein